MLFGIFSCFFALSFGHFIFTERGALISSHRFSSLFLLTRFPALKWGKGAIESKPLSLLLFSRDSCPLIFSLPFPSLFVAAAVLFTPLSALIFILILCFALLLSSVPLVLI